MRESAVPSPFGVGEAQSENGKLKTITKTEENEKELVTHFVLAADVSGKHA